MQNNISQPPFSMARCGYAWLCLSQRHRNRTDLGNLPKDQAACPGFSPARQLEVGMTDLEQPLKPISTLASVYPYLDCYVQEKQTSISCKSLNSVAVCLLCEMILIPLVPLFPFASWPRSFVSREWWRDTAGAESFIFGSGMLPVKAIGAPGSQQNPSAPSWGVLWPHICKETLASWQHLREQISCKFWGLDPKPASSPGSISNPVCAFNSRSWWRTGRPGMLRLRGSQRVRHNWIDWTDALSTGSAHQSGGLLPCVLYPSPRGRDCFLQPWFL